jgi:hypothetical protein
VNTLLLNSINSERKRRVFEKILINFKRFNKVQIFVIFNDILSFVETKFFKLRYIFEDITNEIDKKQYSYPLPDVCFERINHENFNKLEDIYSNEKNKVNFKKFFTRIENPDYWIGFFALLNEKPVGCFWILIPQKIELLYDSFVIYRNSILFCGAYVNPINRGNKIYSTMIYHAHILSRREFINRTLYVIVEKNNNISLRTITKANYFSISGKNYLIKFFGKNILSLYFPKSGNIKIWPLMGLYRKFL